MKKFFLSLFLVIAFAFYVVLSRNPNTQTLGVLNGNTVSQQPVAANTPSGAGPGNPSPGTPGGNPAAPKAGQTSPANKGLYNDGQYVGSVADAYYGNVQVRAVISGGKITDVQFLDYPQDRGTSREINSQAMPYLIQEAIQAQSAQVDGVSGATQTSNAFIQSLDSALSQAKA